MSLYPLAQRRIEPERLDDVSLDPAVYRRAMDGLARINNHCQAVEIMWSHVLAQAQRLKGRPLRILDIATGAGDMPVGLWQFARRANVRLEMAACDRHPVALTCTAELARQVGAPLRTFALDVVDQPLPGGFDLITTSLFLHHLSDDQAVDLLRRMAAAAPAILVMDLRRGARGMAMALLGTPLLTRSGMVYADGIRSYRAAFTMKEAMGLARRAGLQGAKVTSAPSARWVLTWQAG